RVFQTTWEFRHLRDLCRRKTLRMEFLHDARLYNSPSFPILSPDGKTVAVTLTTNQGPSDPHLFLLCDATTGQVQRTFDLPAYPFFPVFSRDSKLVALTHATNDETNSYAITLWNLETGEKRLLARLGAAGIAGVPGCAFSPDGKRLAATV